jgi:hypothetical protein
VKLKAGLAAGGDDAVLADLRGEIDRLSQSTVSDKSELFWRRPLFGFHLAGLARAALGAWRS